MAFCKFSSEFVVSSSTSVDNIFINNFLPFTESDFVKVYLYGLYKCHHSDSPDNSLESFAAVLKLTEDRIMEAFKYFQSEGLVQIINTIPLEIRYMPLTNVLTSTKKYKPEKYTEFNIQIQNIIEGRMITPNEYAEYYTVIEAFHMEQNALIMIAKYCTNLKGANVGHSYITTVAKNWAREGVLTSAQAEEKLMEHELATGKIKDIFSALKLTRNPSLDEKQDFIKWQKEYKFDYDTILEIAKNQKGKTSFAKLGGLFDKYHSLNLLSVKEIEGYEKNKKELLSLSKEIVKNLGLYYESLETVAENYTSVWLNKGFQEELLLSVSKMCLKQNIRSLEGMDIKLNSLYKIGVISTESFNNYAGEVFAADKLLQTILTELGITRLVTNTDRSFFRTWTYNWGFNEDVILYVASLASSASSPMQYMNKILSEYNKQNIKTIEEIKKASLNMPKADNKNLTKKSDLGYQQRDYSAAQVNALFDNLEEVLDEFK